MGLSFLPFPITGKKIAGCAAVSAMEAIATALRFVSLRSSNEDGDPSLLTLHPAQETRVRHAVDHFPSHLPSREVCVPCQFGPKATVLQTDVPIDASYQNEDIGYCYHGHEKLKFRRCWNVDIA